jgi:hypothetical protein
MIKHGRTGFHHLFTLPNYPRKEPRPPHARGLHDADKHRPLQVSGSVGPKHQPRWDIATGTHMPLALRTRVGNPSHRLPTSLCLGNKPKITLPGGKHHLVRNHLLCVIFHKHVSKRTSPQLDNDAREAFLPLTSAADYHHNKKRQHLIGRPAPLGWQL